MKLPQEIDQLVADRWRPAEGSFSDAVRAAAHGGSAMIDAKGAAAPAGPWTDAELFSEAARRAAAADPFALCTVVGTARSAPRDAGAKMLVAPDGSICGSVGGGPLEASVIFEALQFLRGGSAAGMLRFALTTAGDAADPLPPVPTTREDLGMKCGGEVSIFVDVVRPAARLVVYGAGHVGERVANLAADAGLTTVVIDDRPAFAQSERFPRAAEVRCTDLDKDPLGGLRPGPADFVVILTRCHALDEGVLEAALQTPARYVGLIGSRRKVAVILRSISRRMGRDPREDLRLHAPIGLKLGDKSPGEIAISILAEVLLVKNEGELAHNRLASRGSATDTNVNKEETMACKQHPSHPHTHGAGCGHAAIEHEGHTDYLHDGHLHSVHAGHADEHTIGIGGRNPASCTPQHACDDHARGHQHDAKCGHAKVPHGDHVDFMVSGHLHHPHGDHCDDHGPVRAA